MDLDIRIMEAADYETAMTLWKRTEGIGLNDADTREGIARYLEHNPGLSWIASRGGEMVGTILCGHDGRRGYIHHLAVAEETRRRGIARTLVDRAIASLREIGIDKCHVFIKSDNETGIAFWNSLDWTDRVDLKMMSKMTIPVE